MGADLANNFATAEAACLVGASLAKRVIHLFSFPLKILFKVTLHCSARTYRLFIKISYQNWPRVPTIFSKYF
jgi:hypothetical protein